MSKSWSKLPHWIQWLLYLPAVIIASFLISSLATLLIPSKVLFLLYGNHIVMFVYYLVFSIVFVWLSFSLAPKNKMLFSLVMFLLFSAYILISGFELVFSSPGEEFDYSLVVLYNFVWFSVSISMLYFLNKKSAI